MTIRHNYYGLASQLIDGNAALLADPIGKRWCNMFHGSPEGGNDVFQEIIQGSAAAQPKELIANPAVKRSAWERNTSIAEGFNEPGRFTALIGFEWSSIADGNTGHTSKEDWMYQYEYARQALRNGLAVGTRLGVIPFKFGMIGSTDAHTSLATSCEDNFFGKTSHALAPPAS